MTQPSKPEKRFYEVQLGHGFHYYRACEMDAAYEALEEKISVAVEALETLEVAVNDKVNDPGATNFIREALKKIKGGENE